MVLEVVRGVEEAAALAVAEAGADDVGLGGFVDAAEESVVPSFWPAAVLGIGQSEGPGIH